MSLGSWTPWAKTFVIVETVGVGQDGVAIVRLAQTCVVVTLPGLGDGLQAVKAGVFEVGHIYVVNKSDREGADQAARDLHLALCRPGSATADGWTPPVLLTSAVSGRGVDALIGAINAHRRHLVRQPGRRASAAVVEARLTELLADRLRDRAVAALRRDGRWQQLVERVRNGTTDAPQAVEALVQKLLK
jgi:LAO/AO transport system kinase